MPANTYAPSLGVPVGTMVPYASGTTIPDGFLACDGSTIDRTSYASLFSVIGTEWGEGDGSTTFHLPDSRGRFLRGHDDGATNDPDAGSRVQSAPGSASGDAVGTFQSHAVGAHKHDLNSYTDNATQGPRPRGTGNTSVSGSDTNPVQNYGTGIGNETRPINISVKYIIKAE